MDIVSALQHRPILILGERFESELYASDPKDGELCVNKAKLREIVMEA